MSTSSTLVRTAAVVIGVAVAGTLTAAAPASENFGGVATDAHTVVTGVVTRDGTPVARADVLLIAWPNDEVMDALEDGERVNTKVVGQEVADSAGRFAVSLDRRSLSTEYHRPDGGVQLEVVVADAADEVSWHFTAAASTSLRSAWGNDRIDQRDLAERTLLNIGPTHVSIDIGKRPKAHELGDEPETWVDSSDEQLTLSAADQLATGAKEPRRALFDDDIAISGDVTPLGQGWCATGSYKKGLQEDFIRTIGVKNATNWVDQTTSSSHSLGIELISTRIR